MFSLLLLPACTSGHYARTAAAHTGDDLHDISQWSQPWLAYLRRDPYPALLVQIDSVAGAQPTPAEIQSLKDFLTTHVDKPAGITIDLRPPVPINTARTDSPQTLAEYASLHPQPNFDSNAAINDYRAQNKPAAGQLLSMFTHPASISRKSALAGFTCASHDPFEPVRHAATTALQVLQNPAATIPD